MIKSSKKRLTKSQVKSLVAIEGELDVELTARLKEETTKPTIYRISGDRYLYVFDEEGFVLPGKGDIYTEAEMQTHLEWIEDVEAAFKRGGGSSGDDWYYYSKNKDKFVDNVEALVEELREVSGINADCFDRSYKSLDLVSHYLLEIGYKQARSELFDALVAYVGEVLRMRSSGEWRMVSDSSGQRYPCVLGPKGSREMMPINVVWGALDAYGRCELRKATANEYRSYCAKNIQL